MYPSLIGLRHSLRTFFPLVRFRIIVEISLIWIAVCRRQVDAQGLFTFSGGGGPQVSEVTCLGRVIRLSLQPLIWSPHLSCKLDQIKMREYMDRGVINYTREQVLNCVLEVVQYICIIICNQPLLFWLLLFSHFIIFFFSEKEKTVIQQSY